jgi:hypothetical protein
MVSGVNRVAAHDAAGVIKGLLNYEKVVCSGIVCGKILLVFSHGSRWLVPLLGSSKPITKPSGAMWLCSELVQRGAAAN